MKILKKLRDWDEHIMDLPMFLLLPVMLFLICLALPAALIIPVYFWYGVYKFLVMIGL